MSKQMAPLYLRSVSGLPRLSFLHDLLGLMDVRNRILFEKTQDSLSVAISKITQRKSKCHDSNLSWLKHCTTLHISEMPIYTEL